MFGKEERNVWSIALHKCTLFSFSKKRQFVSNGCLEWLPPAKKKVSSSHWPIWKCDFPALKWAYAVVLSWRWHPVKEDFRRKSDISLCIWYRLVNWASGRKKWKKLDDKPFYSEMKTDHQHNFNPLWWLWVKICYRDEQHSVKALLDI